MMSRFFTVLEGNRYIGHWISLFAFLGFVSPTVINYSHYGLSWDPAYYLHNAVCMNHAIYHFGLQRISECLSSTAKGPIMEFITLPWGSQGGSYEGIGLAFVGLALFIWLMVMATYLVCMRGGVPRITLLLAAISMCLIPFLKLTAGDMMTDTLLGWTVALALMLIPLEYNRSQKEFWPGVLRGLLWGFVIVVGVLSKVTFGFFVVLIGLSLLAIRWRRSGLKPLFGSLAGCLVAAIPAILIWLVYGRNFVRFAILAAVDLAQFYAVPGMTSAGYLRRFFNGLGWGLIPLLLLLVLFVRGLLIEKQGRLVRLFPITIILGYLITASMSQNRDSRFTIPAMIGLPLCLAWTSSRSQNESFKPSLMLAGFLAVTLFSIPMVTRPEIAPIERTGELLTTLSGGRPTVVVLATDGVLFNVETVELARQLGGEYLRPVRVETLVYFESSKRSLEDAFDRIDKADYVLFLKPGNSFGPDWTMTRAKDYRGHCEKIGTLINAQISPDFDVFKIH
jgi:hypothetical protein